MPAHRTEPTAIRVEAPQQVLLAPTKSRASASSVGSIPVVKVHPAPAPVQRAGKPTLGRDSAQVRPVVSAPRAEHAAHPVVRPVPPKVAQRVTPAVRRNPVATPKPAPPAQTPPVQRSTAAPKAAPAPRPVQRQATSAPAEKPAKPSRSDFDELARDLVDPLMRLLRAEFRHGRERAGRRNDHRR
ncbi:hypothetical protein [Actinokineospora inagensis]|uniref:hypothetical protein n=1 Tax=Actinokineospora inagensis TaxID=103730 RepID=UPI00047B7DBB|nr:hypothetical protein [Actinokineospora inagensis]